MAIQPGTVPAPKPPKPEDKNKPPKPPVCQRVLLGTDGGVYQSFAGGKNWDHLNRIPSGEYYRISLDDTKPYFRIAGGLAGMKVSWQLTGIRKDAWTKAHPLVVEQDKPAGRNGGGRPRSGVKVD